MAKDYVKLQNEIVNDPTNLGYSGKTDLQKANLGNQLTASGLIISKISSDTVRKIILPAVQVMTQASGNIQSKWQPLLTLIGGAQTIDNDVEFRSTMSALVNDFSSLNPNMNQSRVNSYTIRSGTHFESVGIFDSIMANPQLITEQDIGIARNGH